MAWKPAYVTAEELKAHLRVLDDADDDAIGSAIESASRAIDHEAGRQFGQTDSEVVRVYSYDCGYRIDGRPAVAVDDFPFDDLIVRTDLIGDASYSTDLVYLTDYRFWPYNAAADEKPWTHLLLSYDSSNYWPTGNARIQVEGFFGWPAVPAVVKQACLIQASRFFVRRDAAFGIAGSPEVGSEMRLLDRLDPDVAVLLSSVKRHWGAV